MAISDEEILKLWRDKNFAGSFRGVRNFKVLLKTDRGVDVSEERLLKILKTDPIYLLHKTTKRKIQRRHYDVNFYGQLVQIDLAYMFSSEETNYKYFILAVDAYSFKIFVEPLRDKSALTVSDALKKIFKKFDAPIYEVQSDQGKEFLGKETQVLFKSLKILFREKQGKNKASFAEYGILLIKRKLYMLLRSELSKNWVENLQQVCDGLNNTPLKRLGWLTPNSIHSELDSVKVNAARKEANISVYKDPSYKEQFDNQNSYKGDLSENDFVYLDFQEKLFDKSFDVSVSLFHSKLKR